MQRTVKPLKEVVKEIEQYCLNNKDCEKCPYRKMCDTVYEFMEDVLEELEGCANAKSKN